MKIRMIVKKSVVLSAVMILSSCKLSDMTDIAEGLDGSVIDKKTLETAEGARWVASGAVVHFRNLLLKTSNTVARFTDEIALLPTVNQGGLDDRGGHGDGTSSNNRVVASDMITAAQLARVQLEQAIQLIDKYDKADGYNTEANMYGLLGMVHLILADNMCSGIPLSSAQWGGNFEPSKGYPTDSIYYRAVKYFDQGLALSPDSAGVETLLLVGKARALNSLGKLTEAASIAAMVPDGDSIAFKVAAQRPTGALESFYPVFLVGGNAGVDTLGFHVINRKGGNGLIWIDSTQANQDQRVRVRVAAGNYTLPYKPIHMFSEHIFKVASSSEARLIEAEAHLAAREIPQFINAINAVRRTFRTNGGVTLADTTDPGTHESRVDLLFRERAYTFYLTGRRLGDYRRLVRQYGRKVTEVYPTGMSEGRLITLYGANYVLAPELPGQGRESNYNELYFECDSYDP